jgi:ParB/RepB/Spo0J family partition protein
MDLEFHQLELRYESLRVRRPQRERRLLASLAEWGQQVPIVVVAAEEPNRFLVIDGYKRIRALKRLGQDTVSATVWEMGEAEALVLDRSLRHAEAETALEQGWLLAELHQSFGLSLEELARRFDRSVSWVSRRLALVEQLPESVQHRVRRGEIGAHAAMKYLVPMARAKGEDCERLAAAIAHHRFTSQEVAELYGAWRDGPPHLRYSLIEDPKLFLRARRELNEEPVAARADKGLIGDLDLIGAIARRAERRWREAGGGMDSAERENVERCLRQALVDLGRLLRRMEKEQNHHHVESESEKRGFGASSQGGTQASDCPHARNLPSGGQEGDPLPISRGPFCGARGEGRALSAGDLGTPRLVPGKPGPGP